MHHRPKMGKHPSRPHAIFQFDALCYPPASNPSSHPHALQLPTGRHSQTMGPALLWKIWLLLGWANAQPFPPQSCWNLTMLDFVRASPTWLHKSLQCPFSKSSIQASPTWFKRHQTQGNPKQSAVKWWIPRCIIPPHLGYPLHSTWDFPTWWCLSPTWTQSFPPSRLITATHWSSPGLKAPAFRKVRASCNSNNRPPMRAAICFEASQVKLQPSLCHTGPGLAADSEAIHSSVRANGGFPETSSPHLGYPPHWSQWDFPTRWILFPTCSQSRPPLRPSFRSTATHWSSPGQMGPWCFRNSLPSWHEEESVGCASDSS